MTQEQKQLLLVDLCARLPYRVIAYASEINKNGIITDVNILYNMVNLTVDNISGKYELVPLFDIKPYLRPMSSMTEVEKKELEDICTIYNGDPSSSYEYFGVEIFHISRYGTYFESDYTAIDWLNAHHFDYRGLIEKGLALEAPEGMYDSKNNTKI
jgi:hypothetical protein